MSTKRHQIYSKRRLAINRTTKINQVRTHTGLQRVFIADHGGSAVKCSIAPQKGGAVIIGRCLPGSRQGHRDGIGVAVNHRYSDNTLKVMRETLKTIDMEAVWAAHQPSTGRSKRHQPKCQIEGCAA